MASHTSQKIGKAPMSPPTASEIVLMVIVPGGYERYVIPVEWIDSWIKLVNVVRSLYRSEPSPRVWFPGMTVEVPPEAWPGQLCADRMYFITLELSLHLRIEHPGFEFNGPKSIDIPNVAFTSIIADVANLVHKQLEDLVEMDQLRVTLIDYWGVAIPEDDQLTRYSYRNKCCIVCRLDRATRDQKWQ